MRLQPLSQEAFMKLYTDVFPADFPAAEIKPPALLRRLWDEGVCTAWILTDDEGVRRAYAVLQRPHGETMCLLDYLAVDASIRGQGIGGQMLEKLCEMLGDCPLLLEIERVSCAATPSQREQRERRRRFYRHNGAVSTGVFTRADGGVEYEILCLSPVPLTGAAAVRAMHRIYETLFSPGEYAVWEE